MGPRALWQRGPVPHLTSLGVRVETTPEAFGELRDSTEALADVAELRRRFAEEGYLRLRGLLDLAKVGAARLSVLADLAARGLLDRRFPAADGVAARRARVSTFGFEAEDRRHPPARALVHSGPLLAFFDRFLDGDVRAFDYLWMRLMAPGQATPPHADIVYMGRGTPDLHTAWIPLGRVALGDGPLMILEGSHRVTSLRDGYARMDVDRHGNRRRIRFRHGRIFRGGDYSRHPARVRRELGLRWLTAEFEPGDVLLFTPLTMHSSLDNRSDRFRLSIDARYQRASEPIDERWVGEHPIAHSRAE